MLFNSFEFLLFFPLVTLLYFILPHKFRWILLLIASCIFYMFFIPIYILILLLTIIVDYFAGILIEKTINKSLKKRLLILSLFTNIGILAVFKYYNFFIENFNSLLLDIHIPYQLSLLKIILPIGLSFHTFQAMSYTIEVYRGNQVAEKHFGIYALYVMFYPQLVAGPIERPQNIIHQLHSPQKLDYDRMVWGLKTMLWGFFKKIVIADRLSPIVGNAYNNVNHSDGVSLLIATYCFAFQIYCDFSGYSDIAIGAARIMGIDLMKNFNLPYASRSIKEFWERWHISLSTWFRDYLYIPLGGNRVSKSRWYFNLFIVFLISGFWHGANWTFIIWGILHGFYLVVSFMLLGAKNVNKKSFWLKDKILLVVTFHLIVFAWVFFRADTVHNAIDIIRKIVSFNNYSLIHLSLFESIKLPTFFTTLLLLLLFLFLDKKFTFQINNNDHNIAFRFNYLVYSFLFVMIILFGAFTKTDFIYFQF